VSEPKNIADIVKEVQVEVEAANSKRAKEVREAKEAEAQREQDYAMYVAQVGKRSCATPAIVSFAKEVKLFTIQILRRFDAVLLQFKVTRLIN